MPDEFDKPLEQSDPDGYGEDAEVPLFPQHAEASAEKNKPEEKARTPKQYIHPACDWMWPYLLNIGRVLKSSQFWTAAATVVIAVATVFYTIYAKRQWWELRRSTNAAESAATTASETLKQSIADRRPYVTARIIGTLAISFAKPIQVNIQLINWGRSLATDVTVDGHVWYGEGIAAIVDKYFTEIPLVPQQSDILFLIPNIDGDKVQSPSFKYTTIDSGNQAPSHRAIQFILHQDGGVMAAGRVWYRDTFGNRYRTDFCFRTLLSGAMADCPKHNEIH